MALNEDFNGIGGEMPDFVEESTNVFKALNKIIIEMPSGYSGIKPTMRLRRGDTQIYFDMKDALIFTLANVEWNLTGNAVYVSNSVEVVNGKLVINVEANVA